MTPRNISYKVWTPRCKRIYEQFYKDVVVVRDFGEDRYIMADQYSTL